MRKLVGLLVLLAVVLTAGTAFAAPKKTVKRGYPVSTQGAITDAIWGAITHAIW